MPQRPNPIQNIDIVSKYEVWAGPNSGQNSPSRVEKERLPGFSSHPTGTMGQTTLKATMPYHRINEARKNERQSQLGESTVTTIYIIHIIGRGIPIISIISNLSKIKEIPNSFEI